MGSIKIPFANNTACRWHCAPRSHTVTNTHTHTTCPFHTLTHSVLFKWSNMAGLLRNIPRLAFLRWPPAIRLLHSHVSHRRHTQLKWKPIDDVTWRDCVVKLWRRSFMCMLAVGCIVSSSSHSGVRANFNQPPQDIVQDRHCLSQLTNPSAMFVDI